MQTGRKQEKYTEVSLCLIVAEPKSHKSLLFGITKINKILNLVLQTSPAMIHIVIMCHHHHHRIM